MERTVIPSKTGKETGKLFPTRGSEESDQELTGIFYITIYEIRDHSSLLIRAVARRSRSCWRVDFLSLDAHCTRSDATKRLSMVVKGGTHGYRMNLMMTERN